MTYQELLAQIGKQPTFTLSRAGVATFAKLAVELLRHGSGLGCGFALLVPDRDSLVKMRSLLTLFTPELSSGEQKRSAQWVVMPPFLTHSGWADRMAALYALRSGQAQGVLLTPDSLLLKWIPLTFFEKKELQLTTGEEISPDMILDQAIAWGYERVQMVAHAGEIARRGDILDIMPPGYFHPVRLDFFGDNIESMRDFDPLTQRSKEDLQEITILPARPILNREENGFLLPGACYEDATNLEQWLPAKTVWLLPDQNKTEEMVRAADQRWRTLLQAEESEVENSENVAQHPAVRSADQIFSLWAKSSVVYAEPLPIAEEKNPEQTIDLPERSFEHFTDLFPSAEDQDRPWQTLVQSLKKWQTEKRQIVLSFSTDRSRKKFLTLAEQDGFFPALRYSAADKGMYALISPFRSGADLLWDQTLVLGEDVLQPHVEKSRQSFANVFKGLERYDELKPGDLLVHRDYGIARFCGLVPMTVGDSTSDFLVLQYSGDDKLYLPVDRIALIQRFKGGGEGEPALDRLGSKSWQAGKDKVRKAVEKIAADLVEMYAWRKVGKGFRYPPTGELYREFEASFGFEETPDQAKAIQDVLSDMEKPEPMDRLICGDVGFGKTEVALRAAFRAASEGRQVALLCPTTVLAEQHFHTFRSRMSGFAVNVGLLSRFVSQQKQKEVIKAAAEGQIDVLIGTHRLLSKDVVLPNLGLLILDEEQRFGVRHKEKLKQMRKNVDVLTLTATPIPRTLQLSISGVRELSVIETAPLDRKPVSTALLSRDKKVLRQILEKELAREGQIFWVYNRVQGLAEVMAFVHELVPEAKIALAHGQMAEKQLEDTMHAFWHGEIDILVCTAIVESGLDFPRANTLIVDQAQMFGLGQLYQLRGRVGRSDRQAFAGFIVPDGDSLPDTTRERLRIILDLDYLGAGFQIALEDLRLRGAGNILGEVQSGHLNRVGLDLYLEMLEQAVAKLKDGGVPLHTETEISLNLTAHIPESYIADAQERLLWYKKLSSAPSSVERQEMALELRDRFGRLPEPLEIFLAVLDLKQFLGETQAVRADVHIDRVCVFWATGQTALDVDKIPDFLVRHQGKVRLLPPSGLEYKPEIKESIPHRLAEVRHVLAELLPQKTESSAESAKAIEEKL